MTAQATETTLRLSRIIKASPERVFHAWTDPAEMKQWAGPDGVEVEIAEVDLTVGGRYHIGMRSPDGKTFNAVGVYREITTPSRLVYTWQWQEKEHDDGETLVTVEFNKRDGSTELVLTHELPTVESRDNHGQGWESCLNRLEQLLQ